MLGRGDLKDRAITVIRRFASQTALRNAGGVGPETKIVTQAGVCGARVPAIVNLVRR